VYDTSDPVSATAVSGYLFVAKVNKITDYHANKLLRKFPAFIEEDLEKLKGGYSEFEVSIVKNIKGDLPEGEDIQIYSGDGYDTTLTYITQSGDHGLPVVGNTYLFRCVATSDNNLVVLADNGQTLLDGEVNAENVEAFEVVRTYEDAAIEAQDEKKVPQNVLKLNEDRDVFMSKYDDDYTHKGQKIPDEEIVGKE
jgi:hypothetical protein